MFLWASSSSQNWKYFWKIHKIWRKYLQNSQLTLTVTESLSLAPVSVVPEQTYVPWWSLVTAEKMSWSPCTLSWPSGRGPPSLAQERLGAGSPLPWNRIKEVVCDYFSWMFVLTWHTRASSEFSVRVKWLLFGFPRIDTFGGAENNFKLFILYYIQFLTLWWNHTQKVFLFSVTMGSNVCWWADPDRGNEWMSHLLSL